MRELDISIHLMLLFIEYVDPCMFGEAHFNTSHVTVYPYGDYESIELTIFQYISCYCLSI